MTTTTTTLAYHPATSVGPFTQTLDVRDLIPLDLVAVAGRVMLVDSIYHDDILDETLIGLSLESDRVTLSTRSPWKVPARRADRYQAEFCGHRIGDVVTRGQGKLRWRVTGLRWTTRGPGISLISLPDAAAKGTGGLALSAQTFLVPADAIATLNKAV